MTLPRSIAYPVLGYPATGFNLKAVTRSVHHPAYMALRTGLIAARKDAGLHQADLAKRLGRPQSFVSKFENGERRLDVVEFVAICQVLALDPTDILHGIATALKSATLAL